MSRALRSALFAFVAALLLLAVLCGTAAAQQVYPFTGASFGPAGTGSGSFSDPVSIAVDGASGDVLVYDGGDGQVYKFDAAGEPDDFSSTGTNAIAGAGIARGSEGEIAVDSSLGPDAGDIYVANNNVVRIYEADGEFLGELSGGEMCGVAVDPSGNVYVGIYPGTVRKYTPLSNPVTNGDEISSVGGMQAVCNVAVDSEGNLYAASYYGGIRRYSAAQFGSAAAEGTLIDETGRTLFVDPLSGNLFADDAFDVANYDSTGSLLGTSAPEDLSSSFGVAVSSGLAGKMYVSDGTRVAISGPVETLATASLDEAQLGGKTVTLNGTVNPGGVAVTSCQFEYGLEGGPPSNAAACTSNPGSGSAPVPVSATLTNLTPGTYRYRLSVSNANGTAHSPASQFHYGASVFGETSSNVSTNSANVTAQIDPAGEPTSFHLEYGTTIAYGSSTKENDIGSSHGATEVTIYLGELTPGTTYHFRVVATNGAGTAQGADNTFKTMPVNVTSLPDNRIYELVTPQQNYNSEVYQPLLSESFVPFNGTKTEFTFQAADNGARVAYVGGPTVGGNEAIGYGLGNEYLATRAPGGGWTQKNISPENAPQSLYEAFSHDLSIGFLESLEPLSTAAPGYGEPVPPSTDNYDTLYSIDLAGEGPYSPLFTTKPPYRSQREFRTAGYVRAPYANGRHLAFAGSSEDSSHMLFLADDALTGPSEGRPAAEGGPSESFASSDNLYESMNGRLRLVNVLPDGSTHVGATFGGGAPFDRVISSSGSRIFWTDLTTGHIYMRENDSRTVEVSPEGQYQTASSDGLIVFYTNGDLYEYEVASAQATDLTPGLPIETVMGASEDGKYVYFETTSGEFDMWHDGSISTIVSEPVRRAEVTPDGHAVAYESQPGSPSRIHLYDADTGTVYCASCTAGGTTGVLPKTNEENVYQPRWLSNDGSRVFFDSNQALVPQDSNGKLDVYEWERPGAGNCRESAGCVYLLSGGTSTDSSYFIDASENGDDVFISTRAQLLGADENDLFDIYDVRANGVAPPTPLACTGTGCQGVPSAPPIFATPSSVTYEGVGNFATAGEEAAKSKAKPKKKPNSKSKRKLKKRNKPKNRSKNNKKGAHKAAGHKRSGAKGGRS